jgi:hypothetical protein
MVLIYLFVPNLAMLTVSVTAGVELLKVSEKLILNFVGKHHDSIVYSVM